MEEWLKQTLIKLDQDPAVFNHSSASIVAVRAPATVAVVPPGGNLSGVDFFMSAIQEGEQADCAALDQPVIHLSAKNAHVYDDRVEYEERLITGIQEWVKGYFDDPRPAETPLHLGQLPKELKGMENFILSALRASDPEGRCAYEIPQAPASEVETREQGEDVSHEALGDMEKPATVPNAAPNTGKDVLGV